MYTKDQIIDMHYHLRAETITNKCIEELNRTDWTQMPDVLEVRPKDWVQAWKDYREALRAVTNSVTNDNAVGLVFPIAPDQQQATEIEEGGQ